MHILRIRKSGVLTVPHHIDVVCRTVTVLGYDTLAGTLIFCIFVVIAVTVQEENYIRILLDRTRVTQV